MRIREIAAMLGAEICHDDFKEADINSAYTSDLLSDVIANAQPGSALITIQAHKNTVAVASMMKAPLIIICNSRPLPEDMLEAARNEGIALIRTQENQFTVSGKLYKP